MAISYWVDSDLALFAAGGVYIEKIDELDGESATFDQQGNNTITRRVGIVTKNKSYGVIVPLKALKYIGVMTGTPYVKNNFSETDPNLFVSSISLSQQDGKPTFWEAEISYNLLTWAGMTYPNTQDPIEYENPLALVPIPQWQTEAIELPLWTDVSGDKIVNSAGKMFATPLTRTHHQRILVIERNEPNFNEALAGTFRGKANSQPWNGYDSKKVLLRSVSATDQFHPFCGVYYKVRYEFLIHDGVVQAWMGDDITKRKVLDCGWVELINGKEAPIMYSGMAPAEIPLLNGAGTLLSQESMPVFLDFEVVQTVDFAPLNIVLF